MADEELQEDVAPRAFWSGTITFGLVSIPVALFPANRSQGVSLRMVSPDGVPLQRRYFCTKDGTALDWDDIVRGYEIEKGRFVVVTDDELERLAPEKTRDIDLRRFVDAADIDPMHFERAYFLTPAGNSTKAYRLLAETMEQSNRAGIATFVMRGREYLVAIMATNGILRAETLRFADEVRSPADVGLDKLPKPKAADVTRFGKAIRALKEDALDASELEDGSAQALLDLVEAKLRNGDGVVSAGETSTDGPGEGVVDLMDVLRRALRDGGGSKKEHASAGAEGRRARGRSNGSASGAAGDEASLASQTKEALYERARELDIEGRSSMSKQQLIRAIRKSA